MRNEQLNSLSKILLFYLSKIKGESFTPLKLKPFFALTKKKKEEIKTTLNLLKILGYIVENSEEGPQLRVSLTEKGFKLASTLDKRDILHFIQPYIKERIEIKGKVFTGKGEGRYYMRLPQYVQQFKEKLGFTPYPGTLNIKISPINFLHSVILDILPGIVIEGFEADGKVYGSVKCFPAEMDKEVLGAVIKIERTDYSSEVIEIISPHYLRKKLNLVDGSVLEVRVKTKPRSRNI